MTKEQVLQRLEEMRKAKGMSLKEIADACGIAPATMTKVKRGENVTLDTIVSICNKLECKILILPNDSLK